MSIPLFGETLLALYKPYFVDKGDELVVLSHQQMLIKGYRVTGPHHSHELISSFHKENGSLLIYYIKNGFQIKANHDIKKSVYSFYLQVGGTPYVKEFIVNDHVVSTNGSCFLQNMQWFMDEVAKNIAEADQYIIQLRSLNNENGRILAAGGGYGMGSTAISGSGYGIGTAATSGGGFGIGSTATSGSGYGIGSTAPSGSGYGIGTAATSGGGFGIGSTATAGGGYGIGSTATSGSGYGIGTAATSGSGYGNSGLSTNSNGTITNPTTVNLYQETYNMNHQSFNKH